MEVSPVIVVLVGFIAVISLLATSYAIQRGVVRLVEASRREEAV